MSFRAEFKNRLLKDYRDLLTIADGYEFIDEFFQKLEEELKPVINVTNDLEVNNDEYYIKFGNVLLYFERHENNITVLMDNPMRARIIIDTLIPEPNGTLTSTYFSEISGFSNLFDNYLEKAFGNI